MRMSIDKQSDFAASLQIGPTSLGMVRIYVEGDGIEVPMDFDPDEAEEIAEEIRAAAARARAIGEKPGKAPRKK
jgi:ArsR family metal-binding transcriptional regulator